MANFLSDTAINKNIKNWIKKAKIEKDITFYLWKTHLCSKTTKQWHKLKNCFQML